MTGMVHGPVFVDPDFDLSLLIDANKLLIYIERSKLFVDYFIARKHLLEYINAVWKRKLRQFSKSMSDSFRIHVNFCLFSTIADPFLCFIWDWPSWVDFDKSFVIILAIAIYFMLGWPTIPIVE